ncbi:hypothetical protein ACFOD4_15350 [Pseudoroseomonas globiformis]|uniref:Holin n=1 Tax=Teichococcus globiformis TaxID=2307229 RepID=A0ABV7G4N8_9PROT
MEAWLRAQLSQPSTWRGLFLLITALFGISLSPEMQAAVPNAAIALLGLWEAIRKGACFGQKGD